MKSRSQYRSPVYILIAVLTIAGCSTGAAPTGAVSVSADDVKAGTIHVAKTYLDAIEQMPQQNRQLMVSKNPHALDALKKAVAIDPATKTRMDSMGLKLP